MRKSLLLLCVSASVGILLATASTASAGYGTKAAYQVEISSNPKGSGFWIWAELDQGYAGGDYQESDCIHMGRGGPNGALHDSGEVQGWSIDPVAGTLTMHGVEIIGDNETVDVTVPLPANGAQYGHSYSMTLTYTGGIPIASGTFPAQVQLAP